MLRLHDQAVLDSYPSSLGPAASAACTEGTKAMTALGGSDGARDLLGPPPSAPLKGQEGAE